MANVSEGLLAKYGKRAKTKKAGKSEHVLINHVEIGQKFSGTYFVRRSFKRQAKNGRTFMDFELADKSGWSLTRYWGVEEVPDESWVKLTAHVEEYAGQAQIIIAQNSIVQVDEPADLSNYIRFSETHEQDRRDFLAALADLRAVKTTPEVVGNMISKVLFGVFTDGFTAQFLSSPLGEGVRYGCQGGLLACTVSTYTYVDYAAGLSVSQHAIARAAALLFGVGAVDAYEIKGCGTIQTNAASLIGLRGCTLKRIAAVSSAWELDAERREVMVRLEHAVMASPHYGIKPMTAEACLLSYARAMDQELAQCYDFLALDSSKGEFTGFDAETRRRYFRGSVLRLDS